MNAALYTEMSLHPNFGCLCEHRVEEGLVQKDSPWCGTKRFGMCYVDNEGRMAAIGTTLEIMVRQEVHLHVEDVAARQRIMMNGLWLGDISSCPPL